MEFPQVKEEIVSWGRQTRIHCPNYKAIVNPKTGNTYSIVSNNYQLVKHEEGIATIEEVLLDVPEFNDNELKINLINNGAKMQAKWRFPQIEYNIGTDDLVNPTIELKNSYDTSWQFEVRFGAYRLVCSNGLVIGKQFFYYVKRHTQSLAQKKVKQILIQGLENFSDQIGLWKRWADKNTTSTEYEHVINNLPLSNKDRKAIEKEVEKQSEVILPNQKILTLSKWAFYNIITTYITHRVNSQIKRANLETALRKIF